MVSTTGLWADQSRPSGITLASQDWLHRTERIGEHVVFHMLGAIHATTGWTMTGPHTLSKWQSVGWRVMVRWGLRSRQIILLGWHPRPRVWRRRVRVRPRADRVIVRRSWSTVRSGRRRIFRRSRVQPWIFEIGAPLVLRGNRAFGRHERLVVSSSSSSSCGVSSVVAAVGSAATKHGASSNIGVNGGQSSTEFLRANGRLGVPRLPMGKPRGESILLVVDTIVNLPLEGKKPLEFHGV